MKRYFPVVSRRAHGEQAVMLEHPDADYVKYSEVVEQANKLRRLAYVIREHGTCAAAALEYVADELTNGK